MNFKELSKRYMDSVTFEQLESQSRKMYGCWLKRVPESATGSPRQLYVWINSLPLRGSSKNLVLAVLQAAYTWGINRDLITQQDNMAGPIKRFRSTAIPEPGFTKDEINAIYGEATGAIEIMCATFLRVLFWTGARPAEILRLEWPDINYDRRLITIRSAKYREQGAVSRYCNLLPVITDCLQVLYESKDDNPFDNRYIFKLPGYFGRRLNIDYARRKIQKIGARIGIHKTLRQARTGLATAMLHNKYTIVEVQHTLGHKSIQTTQRYLRVSESDKARAFKGL